MIYQWKQARFGINAQDTGEELERIADKYQSLTPCNIVAESRDEASVLHDCFEWDDPIAADKYREVQAGAILRNIVTVEVDGVKQPKPIRAFVNIESDFKPISVIIKTPKYHNEMMQNALQELHSFQEKYQNLTQLSGVFQEIEKLGA
ncbi:hypothetical protein LJC49_06730 [Ruminococcaceae bacterium OttesenSCG-928-I18]|nr:hypothetical protein [Ruminococcaceae bacterium OttesenSCG-928-I18]